eukprot:COSAG05_NODE_819_length_7130_cov_2.161855_3_plen_69_part_00
MAANYVDLDNPHNLMPHLERGETLRLVQAVRNAFATAMDNCGYEFQEAVREPTRPFACLYSARYCAPP